MSQDYYAHVNKVEVEQGNHTYIRIIVDNTNPTRKNRISTIVFQGCNVISTESEQTKRVINKIYD
jgi:hypothetical protein